MTKTREAGRLALRVEGLFWNAYYALPDTMEDAILLGSIRMAVVVERPDRKAAFTALMQDAMSDLIEIHAGTRPEWPDPPVRAPEHERGGNA